MRSILLLLGFLTAGLAHAAGGCPDLTGRYRMPDRHPSLETGHREVMTALRLEVWPAEAHDLEISASPDGRTMQLDLVSAPDTRTTTPYPRAPLAFGTHYDCADGWVSLRKQVPGARRQERAYLEGGTLVRLRRAGGGGLTFELRFSGVERTNLYSYDSARISVPRLLGRRAQIDTYHWMPASLAPPPPKLPDPAKLAAERAQEALRARVSELTGGATIGMMKAEGEGTRLQLIAANSDAMLRIEDRLLASDLAYAFVQEPYWVVNRYIAEILVSPAHGGAARRPSAFRIEKELNRLMCKTPETGAQVVKMARSGDGYVARVALPGGLTAAEAADCVNWRGSPLIARVLPIGTEPELASGQVQRELSVWRVDLWR